MTVHAHRFPGPIVNGLLGRVLVAWGALLLIVAAIIVLAGRYTAIDASIWLPVAATACWFLGGIGWWTMHQVFPVLVAHGRTRRAAARDLATAGGALALFLAVLVTAGAAAEWGLHVLLDRGTTIGDTDMPSAPGDLALIFLDYLMAFAVWLNAGGLIGAAFYRGSWVGLLMSAVAIAIVGVTALTAGFSQEQAGSFSIMTALAGWLGRGWPLALVVSPIGIAAAMVLTWHMVRDVPLRRK